MGLEPELGYRSLEIEALETTWPFSHHIWISWEKIVPHSMWVYACVNMWERCERAKEQEREKIWITFRCFSFVLSKRFPTFHSSIHLIIHHSPQTPLSSLNNWPINEAFSQWIGKWDESVITCEKNFTMSVGGDLFAIKDWEVMGSNLWTGGYEIYSNKIDKSVINISCSCYL